ESLTVVSRHTPADGGPPILRLAHKADSAGAKTAGWHRRPPGRGVVFFLKEPSSPDVYARTRGEPPREVVIDRGEKSTPFALDWSAARDDAELPRLWRAAVRQQLDRMEDKEVLGSFARYALARLDPDAARDATSDLSRR